MTISTLGKSDPSDITESGTKAASSQRPTRAGIARPSLVWPLLSSPLDMPARMIAFVAVMPRAIAKAEWLEGNRARLRLVEPADCGERYLSWLLDPEVNRYLETRWSEQTLDTVRAFVASMADSPDSYLFAIVDRESGGHVGNVKIGPVNRIHQFADVSYFVGDRGAWGKGFGTEAVVLATRFGFERLGLHRVQAGLHETNIGSRRVLEKSGFTFEGALAKKLRGARDGEWEDHLWFGALRDTWVAP